MSADRWAEVRRQRELQLAVCGRFRQWLDGRKTRTATTDQITKWLDKQVADGTLSDADRHAFIKFDVYRTYREYTHEPRVLLAILNEFIEWTAAKWPTEYAAALESWQTYCGQTEHDSEADAAHELVRLQLAAARDTFNPHRYKQSVQRRSVAGFLSGVSWFRCSICGQWLPTKVRRRLCSEACEKRRHANYMQTVRAKDREPLATKCEHCGNAFEPKRATGRYCSTKCRVYASRAKKAKA